MYDDTARKLAVKVIGTVESDLNYSAVNYNDPITVGIAQWYGTRAASVLCRMRDENPSSWYGVAGSIANQLATIAPDNGFWNGRYLTTAEGQSLTGVLSRNQTLQNTQLEDDLTPYAQTAVNYGFSLDNQTQLVIYFFCANHQSPQSALEVVKTLNTESTIYDIHAATMAHPVLGQYGSRYQVAFDLIREGGIGGVDPVEPEPEPETFPNGNTRYIEARGDLLVVRFEDGESLTAYPLGNGRWTPRKSKAAPAPETPEQPALPPSNGGNGGWTHPLPGATITSGYGPRGFDGFHYGTDFSTGPGSGCGKPVVAPTDMRITRVVLRGGANDLSYGTGGNYVKGYALDGSYSFAFYHMCDGSLKVSEGQEVKAGTQLGVEGSTGNVTGMHLHFEVSEGQIDDPWTPPYGNPIDALPVLRKFGVNV